MSDYPALEKAPPPIYTIDHHRDWEAQLQNLAVINHIIKDCEACNIPVAEARKECDDLCDFYRSLQERFLGPQAAMP